MSFLLLISPFITITGVTKKMRREKPKLRFECIKLRALWHQFF